MIDYDIAQLRDESGKLLRLDRYTSSLDAAMQLVPVYHKWAVYGGGYATVTPWDGTEAGEEIDLEHVRAATPALALCAAALRAHAQTPARKLKAVGE